MNLTKNQPCPHCGRYDNRGTTIDAIIIKDNKILLIKRGIEPDKGKWATPGGYNEWDETVEETVKREVKEETGLIVTSLKFLKVASDPKRHPKQTIDHVYIVEARGEPKANDDAEEVKWFDFNNIPDDMAFDNRQSIEEALKLLS